MAWDLLDVVLSLVEAVLRVLEAALCLVIFLISWSARGHSPIQFLKLR